MSDLPTTVLGTAELANLVGNMVDCYKETKINSEIQETEREKVRQEARVFIAQYENDTKKAIAQIQAVNSQNIEMIDLIRSLLARPELDENCVKLCEIILSNLR